MTANPETALTRAAALFGCVSADWDSHSTETLLHVAAILSSTPLPPRSRGIPVLRNGCVEMLTVEEWEAYAASREVPR